MQTKTDSLSAEEINSLQAELRNYYITSICGFLIIIGFMHVLFYVKFDQFTFPKYEAFILIAMIFLARVVSNKFIKPLRDEIELCSKTIEYLTVESKYDYKDRDDGDGPVYIKYVIVANGKKYVVPELEYKKAEVSDLLAIHKTPLRDKQLKTEIIKSIKAYEF